MSDEIQKELEVIGEEDRDKSKLQKTKEDSKLFEEENKREKNKHKHRIFIGSLYLLWALAIIIVLIRFYHFMMPVTWYWLDADQIQALDKLVFSGAIGTLLGRYGKKLVE